MRLAHCRNRTMAIFYDVFVAIRRKEGFKCTGINLSRELVGFVSDRFFFSGSASTRIHG